MRWVTRKRIHVNRTATGWLVRRFLDPDAEILFVEPEEVRGLQESEGALGNVEILDRASFLYDSLYAHLRRRFERA